MDSMKNIFRDARRTINEREKKAVVLKKDWNETWIEYTKRQREYRRQARLDACIPHRKCVVCENVKLKSRQWIILNEKNSKLVGHKVICKSCWMIIKNKLKERGL